MNGNMMKRILFIIALLGLISCEKLTFDSPLIINAESEELYKSSYKAEQLLTELETAYNQYNRSLINDLGLFFTNWNKRVNPNSINDINQNETVKAIFDIYKTLYKPSGLLELGDWEWGNSLNSGSKYVVIQNKISYCVLPHNDIEEDDVDNQEFNSISNFRPPVDLKSGNVLYLTDEYEEALNIFLGSQSTELGDGGIMNPSMPSGESEKRYLFLRQYIPILHGHWGGYWHIETHPHIYTITFNKKLNKARAFFRVGYMGGEATLEKVGINWRIKESKATWIE